MATSIRAGERLRRVAADPEASLLPRELRMELEASLAQDDPHLSLALVRELHRTLREAGEALPVPGLTFDPLVSSSPLTSRGQTYSFPCPRWVSTASTWWFGL